MRRWLIVGACVLVAAAVAAGVAVAVRGGEPSASPALQAPDTIVHHGRITTMDGRGSTVQALAIRDGEIVAAGSRRRGEGAGGRPRRG